MLGVKQETGPGRTEFRPDQTAVEDQKSDDSQDQLLHTFLL